MKNTRSQVLSHVTNGNEFFLNAVAQVGCTSTFEATCYLVDYDLYSTACEEHDKAEIPVTQRLVL